MATANAKQTEELTESAPSEELEPAKQGDPEAPQADTAKVDAVSSNAEIDAAAELRVVETELQSVSFKNTTRLVTLENNLNRFRKFIPEGEEELTQLAEQIKTTLQEKFISNSEHQTKLKEQTEELVKQLGTALEAGKSLEALPTWDKIQGNISNTNGEIRQGLQTLTLDFKTKINELRDWKIFAATEKKKELIQQMEALKDSKSQPGEKSKQISKLHKEWKELGRSNQNEELWQQFKNVSDTAYEPCKQYFKERKQIMAANLKARRELCEQLEEKLTGFESSTPNPSEVSKELKSAEEFWKKHAPVEQSRIKQIQKRYYASINQLRKLRKEGLRSSAKRKSELIEQAKELLKLDDRSEAMSKAKQLQQDWKEAGQSSFKEDKELWEKFRAVCDELFSQKDKARSESKAKTSETQKQLEELLSRLENLLPLESEELRASKPEYQNLQQSFVRALDELHAKAKGKFRDRFNNLKRKLDTRIRSLPDKKSQALLELLKKCLAFLQPLEVKLLKAKGEDFDTSRKSFDEAQWNELIQDSDEQQLALLQERVTLIKEAKDADSYQSAAIAATDQLRELCIEAEIRAGTETPVDDQAKRMELQLSQLKKGFGQKQPDRDSNIKFVHQSRINCLCLGPISQEDQQLFSARLENSLQRLI